MERKIEVARVESSETNKIFKKKKLLCDAFEKSEIHLK